MLPLGPIEFIFNRNACERAKCTFIIFTIVYTYILTNTYLALEARKFKINKMLFDIASDIEFALIAASGYDSHCMST